MQSLTQKNLFCQEHSISMAIKFSMTISITITIIILITISITITITITISMTITITTTITITILPTPFCAFCDKEIRFFISQIFQICVPKAQNAFTTTKKSVFIRSIFLIRVPKETNHQISPTPFCAFCDKKLFRFLKSVFQKHKKHSCQLKKNLFLSVQSVSSVFQKRQTINFHQYPFVPFVIEKSF